jgi:Oxidoreductase-like protein, N-terminal
MRRLPDPDRDSDSPPIAPVLPDIDACCGQGCDPCVFDVYAAAQERYLAELRAWQARQAARGPDREPRDKKGR